MGNLLKQIWHYACWPLLAFVIFSCVQAVCMIPMGIMEDTSEQPLPSYLMGASLAVSNILTIVIILLIPNFGLRSAFNKVGSKAGTALVGVIGTLAGALTCNLLNETLSLELPSSFESLFQIISESWIGLITVGVLGPIAEEVVFRGGIMRPLLNRGASPWLALTVSALMFGFAHGNLAQGFFAMLLGILLGILYLRTRSLVLCSLCHIINNSCSLALMVIYGEAAKDMKLSDMLCGSALMWMILLGVLCIVSMIVFWRHTKRESMA